MLNYALQYQRALFPLNLQFFVIRKNNTVVCSFRAQGAVHKDTANDGKVWKPATDMM